VLVAFGKSMLSGKREVGAAKFGTSNKHTLGSFKKPAQNHDPHYPGPGKYMLMSSIGKQTESQRPTPKSTTFGKQMKIDGPGSFFNEGSEDMPGIKRNRNLLTRMDSHMVGGALTLCCLFVFCLSFVCLLFVFCLSCYGYCLSFGCLLVVLWLLFVFCGWQDRASMACWGTAQAVPEAVEWCSEQHVRFKRTKTVEDF
jgi:hypothetical protein